MPVQSPPPSAFAPAAYPDVVFGWVGAPASGGGGTVVTIPSFTRRRMRGPSLRILRDRAAILRRSDAQDAEGSPVASYSVTAASVACLIGERPGVRALDQGGLQSASAASILVAWPPPTLDAGDLVIENATTLVLDAAGRPRTDGIVWEADGRFADEGGVGGSAVAGLYRRQ